MSTRYGGWSMAEVFTNEEVTMSEMMNDYEMTRAQLAHLVEETQWCLSLEELAAVREYLEHGSAGWRLSTSAMRCERDDGDLARAIRATRAARHPHADRQRGVAGVAAWRTWHVREFRQRSSPV